MSFRVVIEEEAEREFAEAVTFYDMREPGVGQRFAQELQAFFKTVCQDLWEAIQDVYQYSFKGN